MAEPTSRRPMVTVASKLPHGLVLELHESRKEPPMPGARDVDVFYSTGERVEIDGLNAGHPDSGKHGRVVMGYALTDIDGDFWAKWLEQNKTFPPLVKGFIFAQPTQDRAAAQAKDHSSIKTGMEPLDPEKPAPGIVKDDGK